MRNIMNSKYSACCLFICLHQVWNYLLQIVMNTTICFKYIKIGSVLFWNISQQCRKQSRWAGLCRSLEGHELLNYGTRNINATGGGPGGVVCPWNGFGTCSDVCTLLLCLCVYHLAPYYFIFIHLLFYLSLIAHLSPSVLPSIHLSLAFSLH